MTDNEKEFEDFVQGIKFDDSPDPSHRDKLEQNLLGAFAKQPRQKQSPLEIWRTIMNNRITKLAAAVVIAIAVTLGLTIILDYSATPAYAIEQTIEALQNVSTVHVIGTDWDGDPLESWIKVNPETGESEYVCIDHTPHGHKIASTPKGSCVWDENGNIVRRTNRVMAAFDMRFGHLFEDLAKKMPYLSKNSDIKIFRDKDPDSGKEVIVISAITPTQEFEIFVDPTTNLPTKMYFYRADNMAQVLKSADHILYNEELPEGMFDFEIPEECFEPDETPLSDPNNGMLAEGLSQEEASIKIAEQYWNAIIDGDWECVSKLRPLYSAEFWKNKYSKNRPVELMEIGNPYSQRGCSGLLVPCIVKFENGKVFEVKLVVNYREIEDRSSCVIAATWGKATQIE